MSPKATFAIPGDIDTLTGGYIFEKQLLLGLRRIGWDVTHQPLPSGFPDPDATDVALVTALLADLPPDVPVILDGFITGAMPPEALMQMRAPFIAITHHPLAYETGLPEERAQALMQTERANLARAAHVIVPSPNTARMLTRDFAVSEARITVAPPGVLRPVARPAPAPGQPEILVVGQLVPRKGHDTLLVALADLRDLDWTANFAGAPVDAAHAAQLLELAQAHGLADRVRFLGQVATEDLSALYAQAKIFTLATRYEGYGMVFAEAMVHGLPIIACDGGAVPDTVPDDAGLLTPVGDAAALSIALRRVLTDADLRCAMAAASARHGRNLPDWDDTARIVGTVLQRIAS